MRTKRRATWARVRVWAWTALVMSGAWMCAGRVSADDNTARDATQEALRERIRDMRDGVKDVPLPVIIEALAGHRVLPWQGQSREQLVALAARIRQRIGETGIEAARMNEAGNMVEAVVLDVLHESGVKVARPKTASGRTRVVGYPDLEATVGGTEFYIEVKTFSAATIDSTQRSFYLSPSTDFKITRDAVHLLVAIELATGAGGRYHAQNVRWLDLSGLRCDLKYEFNASNRDLYRRESGLVIAELPKESEAPTATPVSPGATGESASPAGAQP